jgi:hypothetical protein
MAVVIEDLKVIFFLSPGTGSTSLSAFFLEHFGANWIVGPNAGKHATPQEVRDHGFDLNSYLCVTTTRNPCDFYISQYHKKRTWPGSHESLEFARTHDFGAFLDRTLAETPDGLLHPIFLNGADIVLRKELLEDDVKDLLVFLKASGSLTLPHENISEGLSHNLAHWYTPDQLERVRAKHSAHFSRFGYGVSSFEPEYPLNIDKTVSKKLRRLGKFMVSEGKDNWLYLSDSSNNVVSQMVGDYSATDRWVDEWRVALDQRMKHVEQLGGKYAHFIVPNTHSAVRKFLPPGIKISRERPVDVLTKRLTALPLWDLTDLFSQQSPAECFIPTDSHWSNYGAYRGYVAVCEALSVTAVDLPQDAFQWEDVVGDLGIKMVPPRSSRALIMRSSAFAEYFGRHINVVNNHVEVLGKARIYRAETPTTHAKILILGDSYTYSNLPFFASTFAETYFFHTRSFDRLLVSEIKPDFVVTINCERFILEMPRNADTRDYVSEYAAKLQLDQQSGLVQPPPSLNLDHGLEQLNRALPIFAAYEDVYDRMLKLNGATIFKIQRLYEILLQREASLADAYDKWKRHKSLRSIVREFLLSAELHKKSGVTLTAAQNVPMKTLA